jgi:hypothetical protein
VVATNGAALLSAPDGQPVCEAAAAVPVGTPVSEPLQKDGEMIQVRVLDAMWHFQPPAKCPAARQNPVWIKAAAVGADYPQR